MCDSSNSMQLFTEIVLFCIMNKTILWSNSCNNAVFHDFADIVYFDGLELLFSTLLRSRVYCCLQMWRFLSLAMSTRNMIKTINVQ